jgi:hypothetical protein
MVGFYSNLFGIKTKFTFLWEDIDEIKEMPISINPSIVVFLRKGRGLDARVGAKGIDGRGRLKFQFLSFVRSGTAFRYLCPERCDFLLLQILCLTGLVGSIFYNIFFKRKVRPSSYTWHVLDYLYESYAPYSTLLFQW